jgi:ABC-2 type transport system permease protein
MSAAVRAEWTKLRSVRSTPWSLVAVVALTVGLGAFVCSVNETSGGAGDDDLVAFSLAGAYFGQLAAVALGVFAFASEHATGTIRATFAANPRRGQVLAVKAALLAALVLGIALVATVAAFLIGRPILQGNGYTVANGYAAPSLADLATWRAIGGATAYLAMVALLGLAAGAIVRHSAGAITIVIALLFGPFIVLAMLPEDTWGTLMHLAPAAGLSGQEHGAPVGPWEGLGITAGWAAAALLLALWRIRRRDV